MTGTLSPPRRREAVPLDARSAVDGDVVVAVEHLGKSFGSNRAVRDVNFAVRRGGVLGLLGPNGAGKTTTVRMLATLTIPDRGRVIIDGLDVVRHAAAVRRIISLAGQYAAVDPHLSGYENLRMVARLHHLGDADSNRRARELLEVFGLVGAGDRQARTYSGGMRRRLDLAASIVNRPAVLFLDEPTTGLDPTSRIGMWTAIRELVDDGTTVVLTTQYLEEADQLCDDLVVVDRGTVVASGTPEELKSAVGGDTIEITLPGRSSANTAAAVAERSIGARARIDPVANRVFLAVGAGSGQCLAVVVRALADAGVAVSGIGVRRPSLNEVFLALTGHEADVSGSSSAVEVQSSAVEVQSPTVEVQSLAVEVQSLAVEVQSLAVEVQSPAVSPERPTSAAPHWSARAGGGADAEGTPHAAGTPDAATSNRGAGAGVVAAALLAAGLAGWSPVAGKGEQPSVDRFDAPQSRAFWEPQPWRDSATQRIALLWSDWRVVAWRNVLRYAREPLAVSFLVLQPLMFVVMFRYVFGGALALAVPGGHFVAFLMPGIMALTMAFASMSTAVGLAEDLGSGMVDRLRSLPIARSTVVAGRLLSDVLQNVVVIGVMVAVGMAVGFRFDNGAGAAVAMVALALCFALSVSTGAAYLGIRTRRPETTMSVGLTYLFPICFVSGAFVPLATLPGWLQPVARANPVTVVVEAMRALALGGPVALRTVEATGWMVGIAAVFVPLAVRAYRRGG